MFSQVHSFAFGKTTVKGKVVARLKEQSLQRVQFYWFFVWEKNIGTSWAPQNPQTRPIAVVKSLLRSLSGKHRAIFFTSSSYWKPVITQYSVCTTSATFSISKQGVYSTGFRRKVGICHLMQRRSVQPMKYSKTRVCRHPSSSLQQGVLGDEKWEEPTGEGICFWWNLCGCRKDMWEEWPCTPAMEKGCLLLLGEGRWSQPDPFKMEREFCFPAVRWLNLDYICPGCRVQKVILEQGRGQTGWVHIVFMSLVLMWIPNSSLLSLLKYICTNAWLVFKNESSVIVIFILLFEMVLWWMLIL